MSENLVIAIFAGLVGAIFAIGGNEVLVGLYRLYAGRIVIQLFFLVTWLGLCFLGVMLLLSKSSSTFQFSSAISLSIWLGLVTPYLVVRMKKISLSGG